VFQYVQNPSENFSPFFGVERKLTTRSGLQKVGKEQYLNILWKNDREKRCVSKIGPCLG